LTNLIKKSLEFARFQEMTEHRVINFPTGILFLFRSYRYCSVVIAREKSLEKTLTLFWARKRSPAAGASPKWDSDVLPVRKITHFQLTPSVSSSCAPSPSGGLMAKEGGFMFVKNDFL
jgi:hypothetical protein